jgi:hypothetical protein
MTSPSAQEQLPANLAALRQSLTEMAASPKSTAPTTNQRPVHGPVIVVRGK